MNSMQIPAHVEQIIHTLNSHGYEAFAVGGCVRDTLLDANPAIGILLLPQGRSR